MRDYRRTNDSKAVHPRITLRIFGRDFFSRPSFVFRASHDRFRIFAKAWNLIVTFRELVEIYANFARLELSRKRSPMFAPRIAIAVICL